MAADRHWRDWIVIQAASTHVYSVCNYPISYSLTKQQQSEPPSNPILLAKWSPDHQWCHTMLKFQFLSKKYILIFFSFWFFTTLFNQQWNKNSILTFVGAFIFNNSNLTNNFKIGQEWRVECPNLLLTVCCWHKCCCWGISSDTIMKWMLGTQSSRGTTIKALLDPIANISTIQMVNTCSTMHC